MSVFLLSRSALSIYFSEPRWAREEFEIFKWHHIYAAFVTYFIFFTHLWLWLQLDPIRSLSKIKGLLQQALDKPILLRACSGGFAVYHTPAAKPVSRSLTLLGKRHAGLCKTWPLFDKRSTQTRGAGLVRYLCFLNSLLHLSFLLCAGTLSICLVRAVKRVGPLCQEQLRKLMEKRKNKNEAKC